MTWSNIENTKKVLLESSAVVILIADPPDIDSLASSLVLERFLARQSLPARLICRQPLSTHLRSISKDLLVSPDWPTDAADCTIVSIDTPSAKHTGFINELYSHQYKKLVVIDHHPVSDLDRLADFVWRDQKWSASAEGLFQLVSTERKIEPTDASLLLLAISADTKQFQIRVTDQTLRIASKLLSAGADRNWVESFFRQYQRPTNQLRLWGEVLINLTTFHDRPILKADISQERLKKLELSEEAATGLIGLLASEQTQFPVVILTVEHADGTIRGQVRSRDPRFHAGKIAREFGGSGFDRAGGFEIKPDSARL